MLPTAYRDVDFYSAQAGGESSVPVSERNLVTRKFNRSTKFRAQNSVFYKPLPDTFVFVPF